VNKVGEEETAVNKKTLKLKWNKEKTLKIEIVKDILLLQNY